jgi:hypothetical protein
MPMKRMVCLANSRKLSGRCIAGRVWDGKKAGDWVRPVSARSEEEVSEYEREYDYGSDPRVLDVIDVPVLEATPKHCQGEYVFSRWRTTTSSGMRSVRGMSW